MSRPLVSTASVTSEASTEERLLKKNAEKHHGTSY